VRAVFFQQHGGVEVLQYGDFPTPEPGPGEVRVQLVAAGLNRMDIWTRQGWPGIKLEYPHILGADGAGLVEALGPGVSEWQVGERVVINSSLSCGHCEACIAGQDNLCRDWHLLGETVRGTYAEYVVVPAGNLYRLPARYSEHSAAAAALVFHTAWHSLIVRGGLRPAETVLVVGASGGANTAYIQIAKLAGATVYVVGSSAEKLALAKSLGADVLIDRTQEENWSKTVYQLTGKRGVDVVVDNVGTTFPMSFRAARKGGRILTVGNTGGPKFEIDNRYIFSKHLTIIGSSMGTRHDFATVMDLVFTGRLKPVLDSTFPLSQAVAAHERLEKGAQSGKITLAIGE
jgi:NADPH:quinone reductase-like Zn-dependent oxidoreductase